MNLSKLFELQRQLDERIEREHLRQEGEDRLAKKILALLVEIGELANCWRGFKFWSNDQDPRTYVQAGCEECVSGLTYCEKCIRNPLLEEYVDCLHFILSIGLELNIHENLELYDLKSNDLTKQFLSMNYWLAQIYLTVSYNDNCKYEYEVMLAYFLGLGEMLGFTWEQIEEAYMKKNAVNHQRQESGY